MEQAPRQTPGRNQLLTPCFLDFWPPELRENKLSVVLRFHLAVMYYSCLRKPIQHPPREGVKCPGPLATTGQASVWYYCTLLCFSKHFFQSDVFW